MAQKRRRKKRRRTRSPHPGIVIRSRKLPSGRTGWRARYTDPDEGLKDISLEKLGLTNHEARTDWAKKKSKALAKRRLEIDLGAPKRKNLPVSEAVDEFYKSCERKDLSVQTIKTYREGTNRLVNWANARPIRTTDALTRGDLRAFRESLKGEGRQAVTQGGKRGERKGTDKRRSTFTVNRDLRSVKAMLNHWREEGWLPKLHRDDLRDCLKPFRPLKEKPVFLKPNQCKSLLEATVSHDAAFFNETRLEHRGIGKPGQTPKYVPVAPLASFVLLTGVRIGEALSLPWDAVNLEARDHEGEKVGEIDLRADIVKTRQARTIDLKPCPSVRTMLAAMKLRAGKSRYVFGGDDPLTRDIVEATRKRLIREYRSGRFSWQDLRRTAEVFLVNAPDIFGSASVFRAARQIGHSAVTAERYYLDVFRGIPKGAATLEQVMGIEKVMQQITDRVQTAPVRRPRRAAKKKRGAGGR